MPINMSALKRERQDKAKRLRNRILKSKIHTAFRKLSEAIPAKNKEEIEKKLRTYMSEVDKAVKKGILHKNTGARKKSRMMKKIAKELQEKQSA